jgi:hydrogenase maturation protease
MKTLVLGLGNPILSDDGVGIRIIQELQKKVFRSDVTIAETYLGGINLLELLTGYEKVILIDAIQTKGGLPGQVYQFGPEALDITNHIASSHEANFSEILKLGRRVGLSLPHEICIYAVEVEDITTFNEECTDNVSKAIPLVVTKVLGELGISS